MRGRDELEDLVEEADDLLVAPLEVTSFVGVDQERVEEERRVEREDWVEPIVVIIRVML